MSSTSHGPVSSGAFGDDLLSRAAVPAARSRSAASLHLRVEDSPSSQPRSQSLLEGIHNRADSGSPTLRETTRRNIEKEFADLLDPSILPESHPRQAPRLNIVDDRDELLERLKQELIPRVTIAPPLETKDRHSRTRQSTDGSSDSSASSACSSPKDNLPYQRDAYRSIRAEPSKPVGAVPASAKRPAQSRADLFFAPLPPPSYKTARATPGRPLWDPALTASAPAALATATLLMNSACLPTTHLPIGAAPTQVFAPDPLAHLDALSVSSSRRGRVHREKKHRKKKRHPTKRHRPSSPAAHSTVPVSLPLLNIVKARLAEITAFAKDQAVQIRALESELGKSQEQLHALADLFESTKHESKAKHQQQEITIRALRKELVQMEAKINKGHSTQIRELELELYKEKLHCKSLEEAKAGLEQAIAKERTRHEQSSKSRHEQQIKQIIKQLEEVTEIERAHESQERQTHEILQLCQLSKGRIQETHQHLDLLTNKLKKSLRVSASGAED
ncbi:uncharacterized protein BJ171DRAFT_633960 [Polychytrium aggregatum]|uniref:uncharacterized protein n=1 Tax=Polychytrium aggregatum TaxID=110093 RepID=UPI0022FEF9DA|nr:uncharacterized protein BJ171DRAFT_633960 [Polychytrium aggregatum]KAI9208162.1 hypothetical protein BJ171DRAFT_633960 [Polychytrium aggregatum]